MSIEHAQPTAYTRIRESVKEIIKEADKLDLDLWETGINYHQGSVIKLGSQAIPETDKIADVVQHEKPIDGAIAWKRYIIYPDRTRSCVELTSDDGDNFTKTETESDAAYDRAEQAVILARAGLSDLINQNS